MRPLVFLDMDDVLCVNERYNSVQMMMCFREKNLDLPELWAGLVDTGAAGNLRRLNDEFVPRYVVSTSWVTYLSREQLVDVFARTGLNFVTENLHVEWATPRALSASRRDEIEWWLDAHREPGQPFLIIDDRNSGWSLVSSQLAYEGHVVLCRSGEGFTDERLQEARLQLQRQGAA
jgi:hypothetical protein